MNTPFRTRDLFDGARDVSNVEILVFFVVGESPASRGEVNWAWSGEARFDGASLGRRPIGSPVVAGSEDKRRNGSLLLGLAEEILMSWIWWSFWMCSRIFEVFAASKEHLGI